MIGNFAPPPTRDPVVWVTVPGGGGAGTLNAMWERWLARVVDWLSSTSRVVGTVGLTTQAAAITTTTLPTRTLATGVYRLSYYLRVTQAASTSSSATVTVGWTDGTQACVSTGAAVTGNTVTTTQSGDVLVHLDAASSCTYAVAYTSVGATPMQYRLDLRVEEIS